MSKMPPRSCPLVEFVVAVDAVEEGFANFSHRCGGLHREEQRRGTADIGRRTRGPFEEAVARTLAQRLGAGHRYFVEQDAA